MEGEKWFSKEIDAEVFYTVVEDLFRQLGPPTLPLSTFKRS
jgi:hypothetical protein